MPLYATRRPPLYTVTRWWKHGDHELVQVFDNYQPRIAFAREPCVTCQKPLGEHGWAHNCGPICPGDYIVRAEGDGQIESLHEEQYHLRFTPVRSERELELEHRVSCLTGDERAAKAEAELEKMKAAREIDLALIQSQQRDLSRARGGLELVHTFALAALSGKPAQ